MTAGGTIQRYNEAQERLRDNYDGDPSEGDLRIEPPKPMEVNPELFKDVEPLLFRGFLHVPAEINGVSFVFKSLNHHELEHLGMSANYDSAKGRQRFYTEFLARGVLMVDGVNVLAEQDSWVIEAAKLFDGLEDGARKKVIRYMSEINRRANRAVLITEAYCLENVSRLRWAQYRGLDLTSPAVTGLLGTPRLGLNWAQLTWRALNYFEDLRDKTEREWENAKFVASAMAGSKGMAQVNGRDKQRREQERTERMSRRDKVLRAALLGEDPRGEAKAGAPMTVARTVEELANQLEKDLRGEKDWHDQVVEAHEKRAREEYQQRVQRLQAMQDSHVERFGPRPVMGGLDSFKGMTEQEVRTRIAKRQQQTAERLAQAKEDFPEAFDPKLAQFQNKWNKPQPSCAPCSQERSLVSPDRPRVLPFKRGNE
jgi:hypothetical protein